MAFTFLYPHLIGKQNPISFSLARAFNRENIPFKQLSLKSEEKQSAVVVSRPLFILMPEFHNPDEIKLASSWLKTAKAGDIPVLLLSSLSVLQAQGEQALDESVTHYSKDKAAAALHALEKSTQKRTSSIILRVGQCLSLRDAGLLAQLVKHKEQGYNLSFNHTQAFSPTPVNQIAEVVIAIFKQISCSDDLWGLYHYASGKQSNLYALAQYFFKLLSKHEDLDNLSLSKTDSPDAWLSQYGVAPADSRLLFNTFGVRPKSWQEGMQRVVDFYYGKRK